MLKDIKKLIRGGNIKTVIIIIGLLGLVLIFLSSFNQNKSDPTSYNVNDYRLETQQSLSEMLPILELCFSLCIVVNP